VEGLIVCNIFGIDEGLDNVAEGEVCERKWGNEKKGDRICMRGTNVDEVKPEQSFSSGNVYCCAELRKSPVEGFLLVSPCILLKPWGFSFSCCVHDISFL
jgi:hypothetical protein